jgi:hypothetical protein
MKIGSFPSVLILFKLYDFLPFNLFTVLSVMAQFIYFYIFLIYCYNILSLFSIFIFFLLVSGTASILVSLSGLFYQTRLNLLLGNSSLFNLGFLLLSLTVPTI